MSIRNGASRLTSNIAQAQYNFKLNADKSRRRRRVAAGAALWLASSATMSYCGVTVSTTNGSFSNFPGAPLVATNGTWDMLPRTLVPEQTDSTQPGQARMLGQIFTATQSFTLTQVTILSAGGAGDGGANPNTIHMYDLNLPHSLPGSYNLTTDTNPAPAVDMFSGGGAGLSAFLPGFADKRFVNFAFTAVNGNDSTITLQAGHQYVFELWGTEGFLTYTHWLRVSGGDASLGNTYSGGDGYNAPTSSFSTTGTFSGLRTQLAGNSRDLLMAVYGTPLVTNAAWAVDADGNWSLGTNWTPNTAPNGAGATANFGAVIQQPRTVTVDTPQTTAQVNFDNANKYTIAGSSNLTLDNTTGGVGITVTSGSHDITAPLVLAKDTTLTVTPAASVLTITKLQTSAVAITKTGAGKAILGGSQTYTGNTTVSGGSLQLNGSAVWAGALTGPGTTNISGSAVIFDYNDGSADPAATIKSILTTGYGSSFATGQIHSSTATSAIGLGWKDDTTGKQVTVLRTYYGDADLSLTVDTVDFNLLAASFSQSGKVWANGDFDYSGTVDTVDFNLLAANFSKSLAGADGANIGGLVPEPTGIALAALAASSVLARRRRARS